MNTFGTVLRPIDRARDSRQVWAGVTLFARLALGIGFLSAVADRFGVWGEPGTGQVAWGDFDLFVAYLEDLAPYLSGGAVDAAAWLATGCEAVLGVALLIGAVTRLSAVLSAGMLLVFALSMFFFSGPEAPFNASVFSAAGLAMLLALAPAGSFALSVDRALGLDIAGSRTVREGLPL
ncbi:DoxX family membrane protein [Nocardia cyriacigeorgica]|uniref:DoxX family membrane protein n=1 Tax=Nocardia cyriacigeorgica TaxID=135487 RepID=A0A6P1CYL3_9NOCA|nr:DoxX family membrane protein [Nocardia cyriacigeorgica]MBF6427096.1 DoxX family membrane protein [Nocardia cyriacigeorgica]NEW36634.1 DoxX family membrane protein [Nocardia cyriacigeorgica]BDT85405.1 hypothetical protein FMUAM8_11690 [Nocardia cyriacigeorgica]